MQRVEQIGHIVGVIQFHVGLPAALYRRRRVGLRVPDATSRCRACEVRIGQDLSLPSPESNMPLKKITLGIKKTEGGGLKKIDMGAIARRREAARALDFVPSGEDALAGMPEDLGPEAEEAERLRRMDAALNGEKPVTDGSTIKADLKRQGEAHKNQGANDYYFTVVFADGKAATEFLKRTGYPNSDAAFVDGYMLAEALGISGLPRPEFKLQKIRPPQRTLERLVTAFPKKTGDEA
jgi:hypothetical protein